MPRPLDVIAFALLCLYLAIMLRAYRQARKPRRLKQRLGRRLAPYTMRTAPLPRDNGNVVELHQHSVKVKDVA